MIQSLIAIGNRQFLVELRPDLPPGAIAVKDFNSLGDVINALQDVSPNKASPVVHTANSRQPRVRLDTDFVKEVEKRLSNNTKLVKEERTCIILTFGLAGQPPMNTAKIGEQGKMSTNTARKYLLSGMKKLGFNLKDYSTVANR